MGDRQGERQGIERRGTNLGRGQQGVDGGGHGRTL